MQAISGIMLNIGIYLLVISAAGLVYVVRKIRRDKDDGERTTTTEETSDS